MKKSLYKKLVRMARDGDPEAVEAVAEIVESLTENDPEIMAVVPEGTAAGAATAVPVAAVMAAPAAVYGPVPTAVPAAPVAMVPAEAPAADPDQPDPALDSDLAAEILNRLDQLITLLTPAAPATDEDPENPDDPEDVSDEDLVEEIVEAVEEAVEAAEVAEDPDAVLDENTEEELAEEIVEAIQEIVDPSDVLEPEGENSDCRFGKAADAAVRKVMKAYRPKLDRMSRKRRMKVCNDIAVRLRKQQRDNLGIHANMGSAMDTKAARDSRKKDERDLGRRIMAKRNANYKG